MLNQYLGNLLAASVVALALLTLPVEAAPDHVTLVPVDCGPLARAPYGVLFYELRGAARMSYVVRGDAPEICPRLLSGKPISGVVIELPNDGELFSPREREGLKEFVPTFPDPS
jgi:hypothetical protein